MSNEVLLIQIFAICNWLYRRHDTTMFFKVVWKVSGEDALPGCSLVEDVIELGNRTGNLDSLAEQSKLGCYAAC